MGTMAVALRGAHGAAGGPRDAPSTPPMTVRGRARRSCEDCARPAGVRAPNRRRAGRRDTVTNAPALMRSLVPRRIDFRPEPLFGTAACGRGSASIVEPAAAAAFGGSVSNDQLRRGFGGPIEDTLTQADGA
jgi:hypothetical protein